MLTGRLTIIIALTLSQLLYTSTPTNTDPGYIIGNNYYDISKPYIDKIRKQDVNPQLVKIGLLDSGVSKYLLDSYPDLTLVNFTDDSHGYDENGHGTFSASVK